jgi:hypothetical protein
MARQSNAMVKRARNSGLWRVKRCGCVTLCVLSDLGKKSSAHGRINATSLSAIKHLLTGNDVGCIVLLRPFAQGAHAPELPPTQTFLHHSLRW